MKINNLVLFSGGTGGHVIPAVNFGNYMIDQGYSCVLFLDKRGLQYSKEFKGKIINIKSAHLSGNIFHKCKSIFLLFLGFIQSFYYLLLFKPSHCIAFGSYATFMPLAVTSILGMLKITKIYLHEQNSIIGKVNLFFLPFAKNIFVNFKDIKNLKLKYIKKIYHVGLPSNDNIFLKKRNVKINQEKKIKIFVYGGSQGSINLNSGVLRILKKLPDNYHKKLFIMFQCPEKQILEIKSELKNLNIEFKIKDFFYNIHETLLLCDILVARSGAGTINDIIKCQIPSILIPLPQSIHNHQYINAKYLVSKKAANLIEEKDLGLDVAYNTFKELFEDINKRITMIKKLQEINILDANDLMIKKIFE